MRAVCSRKGTSRSFGSPQSRNAPTPVTATHFNLANSPGIAFGFASVATGRSSESVWMKTLRNPPITLSFGTSRCGSRTSPSSPPSRYSPKDFSRRIFRDARSPIFAMPGNLSPAGKQVDAFCGNGSAAGKATIRIGLKVKSQVPTPMRYATGGSVQTSRLFSFCKKQASTHADLTPSPAGHACSRARLPRVCRFPACALRHPCARP